MVEAFVAELTAALGTSQVVTDPDVVAGHVVDWTGRWHGRSPAVVRPRQVDDVATLVALARRHRVALVPQGGNTGLVGGSIAHDGEVIVDLRHLDDIGAVDRSSGQVTVGAGVTLARLQAGLAPAGLALGVDLAARDSATIGGMAATNAGGLHVLRHGSMRHQVLGLDVVLGTGEVVRANPTGLVKDNTGYDLAGPALRQRGHPRHHHRRCACGSSSRPSDRVVALLGFGSVEDAVAALPDLRAMPGLQAVELVLAGGLEVVAAHLGARVPLEPSPPCALLVEVGGEGDQPLAELARSLDDLGSRIVASAVAEDARRAARLWRWREAHPEAAAALGIVHKADVTIPLPAMAAFVERVVPTVAACCPPGATTLVYGHLGDGNLHVNVVGPARRRRGRGGRGARARPRAGRQRQRRARHRRGQAAVAGAAAGRRAAVDAMRRIKAALDPDGIMNPGVLLYGPSGTGRGPPGPRARPGTGPHRSCSVRSRRGARP